MILVYLSIILLLCYFILHTNTFEGFTVDKNNDFINENKTYHDERIYDEFYAYIYDDLFLTIPYLEEFILKISDIINKNSNILCIGSKTGHVVELLSKSALVQGIENSKSMVQISNYKYPTNNYLYGNYLDNSLFKSNQFTHVICPMLTINTISDLNQLFENMNKWLIHKGYFIIMLIDLENIKVHKLVNKRPSNFFINSFDYELELHKDNMIDKIKSNNGYQRTDIQTLYPYKEDKIIYISQINNISYKYSKNLEGIEGKCMIFQKN